MAEALGNLGSQIMFYLAAAVSDFYVPEESMVRKTLVIRNSLVN